MADQFTRNTEVQLHESAYFETPDGVSGSSDLRGTSAHAGTGQDITYIT